MKTTNKITRQRFNTDPAFERTRENIAEFAAAVKAVKGLKAGFRDLLLFAGDNKITNRLQRETMRVLKTDPTSNRGQRLVGKGDVEILKGFNFNMSNGLAQIVFLRHTIQVHRASGMVTLSLPAFTPRVRIEASPATTHFQLVAVALAINFETGAHEYAVQETASLPWDSNKTEPIKMEMPLPAGSQLPILVGLGISFEETIHNKRYPLNGGTLNAAGIIGVDMPAN